MSGRRIGLVEPDWQFIGATLARCDDREQAEFFRAFVKECHSWGTSLQVERQLAGVNRLLSETERETLSMLSFQEG